jgi:uncharacterized protein YjbJ (UPF0337 family)
MNWDIVEGKWDQFAGLLRGKWAKLTDDDIELAKSKRDVLFGRLQEKYGINRDQAEREVDGLVRDL